MGNLLDSLPNEESFEPTPPAEPSKVETKLDSLTNIINDLANNQQSVYTEFNNFKSTINQKLEAQTVSTPEPVEEGETDWWSDFDPSSKQAVQAEIKHHVTKLKDEFSKTLDEKEAESSKNRQEESKLLAARQKYDALAGKEFPQLADNAHPSRREFEKVFSEHVTNDQNYGKIPTAVYDTARIAYANLINRGELVPDSFKSEARRLISVNDGTVPRFKSVAPSRPDELSKQQMFMAKKLGVNPESYIKRLRTHYKDRDMS